MRHCKFRSFALAAFCAVALTGLSAIAVAQDRDDNQNKAAQGMAATDNDINRGELRNFDRFLDNHPEVAEQVKQNPSLINDPTFLSKHPALQEFLKTHPHAAEELRENPQAFMHRERGFEHHEDEMGRMHAFDEFLDKHPEVEKDLRQNPSLVNDPNFQAKHPALKDFLEDHPGLRKELQKNPKAVLKRERRLEHHEGDEHRHPHRDRDRD